MGTLNTMGESFCTSSKVGHNNRFPFLTYSDLMLCSRRDIIHQLHQADHFGKGAGDSPRAFRDRHQIAMVLPDPPRAIRARTQRP